MFSVAAKRPENIRSSTGPRAHITSHLTIPGVPVPQERAASTEVLLQGVGTAKRPGWEFRV